MRPDLADVALADRVFAPHYAAPFAVQVRLAIPMHRKPNPEAETVARLQPGQTVDLFDVSAGWSWIRAEGRVGYVPAEALDLP